MKVAALPIFFLLFTVFLNGQSKEEKPIRLTHADSLVGKEIDGEAVREVIGNVEFVQDSVVVRCDRAVQHLSSNRADLYGNVTVIRDTVTLRAPRGMYDGDKRQSFGYGGIRLWNRHVLLSAKNGDYLVDDRIAHFWDSVKVVDSTTVVTGNELTYFENEHKSIVVGDVKVVSTRDNSTMLGGWLEHLDDKKYSKMLQAPKFIQVDTSTAGKVDTLVIVSRQMESFQDRSRRFVGTDSVQLVRGELAGKCQWGIYYPDDDVVELRKEPVIWYEVSQITGDSIRIEMKERRLDRVLAYGTAFAASQSDSVYVNRFDQMTGQKMTLYFSNDELERMAAVGTAVSLYFLYDRGEPNGVNRASGDSIVVLTRDGRAETIKVQGGTEGEYIPEKSLVDSESGYNLPGFIWRTDRPKLGRNLSVVALPLENNGRAGVGK